MKRSSMAMLGLMVLCLTTAPLASAQQILIDKPVRAGELICFPDLNDPMTYYYVTDKPHLATDAAGRPQFSFLRYVENVRSGVGQPDAREGEGGGIVHAVVALSVTKEQIAAAQRDLERTKSGAKLVGPVVFKSGKFGLISSFLDSNGNLTKQVVGLGNAPLLDGEKASVSVQLTKLGAKILWESFHTPTPDLSFTFEMEVAGYRSPHRALVEANFDQIYDHKAFAAGVATQYLAAEIKTAFDDLSRQGAIKLTQVGQDEKLESMITTAYNKIADLMFSPSGGNEVPNVAATGTGNQPSMLDRATQYLQARRQEVKADNEKIRAENNALREARLKVEAASRRERMAALAAAEPGGGRAAENDSLDWGPSMAVQARPYDKPGEGYGASPERQEEALPTFAVIASYEMKSVRQRGDFKVDLNKYTTDHLPLRFDENVGDLRSLMKEGENFRQVNLDDPLYKQRELAVFVDGMNAKDFGDYINFATVQLRKKHQAGEQSQDEVRIDRKNFSAEGNSFKLLYGWKNDADRQAWMSYEYQTTWNFFGGKELQTAWNKANAGVISLTPPFQKASVDLQADPDVISAAGVRLITVKIYYKLGDTEQVKQVTLNASKGQLSDRVDFILPTGSFDYDYEINWQLKGNRTVSSGRKKASQSILFVDEIAALMTLER